MSKLKIKKSRTRHRNKRPTQRTHGLRMRALRTVVTMMAILGGFAGGIASYGQSPAAVLAYATNVNHAGLLASTNQQRSAGGLSVFSIDSRLNSAAQAKANDMVAKDYWSHTSPDGRQPWDFIIAAGYSYNRAGENLAYGALTSEQTVQAWMNSPGHRANILNDGFTQVGFGFANSANYQGSGPQTVVVAMYATPYGAPATPPPPPPPPPKPTVAPATTPIAPAPAPAPASSPTPAAQQPADSQAEPAAAEKADDEQASDDKDDQLAAAPTQIDNDSGHVAPVEQTQTIRRLAVITGNYTLWAVAMAMVLGVGAIGVFFYHHSKALHRWVIRGEEFIIHHPVIDAVAIVAAVTVVVLLQSVGRIL